MMGICHTGQVWGADEGTRKSGRTRDRVGEVKSSNVQHCTGHDVMCSTCYAASGWY